ncbi:MAG: DUF2062 domain-containing protein [Candidatus Omnitrophica bacterium]|nr:DUF2062 domain-containing protein [Candidatus Omnitrophota bacterium]MBU1923331.1 DUF2062 domain-containing protein [Candidatus Omnitrophota bacterium]
MKWKFKRTVVRLFRLNNSPQEIARGVAIGVFIGILPVYGLHTVLVVIAAILIRSANKIAIFLGTSISLPPTIPPITWAGYEIGRYILKGRFEPLSWSVFKNITFQKICSYYQPLFLGSVILGIICAAIFYLLVFYMAKRFSLARKRVRRI